jgi:Acetyltransferase (GNAT) domain
MDEQEAALLMGSGSRGALRLRPCPSDAAWDDLVARYPGATGFHTAGFLRTAGEVLGLQVRLAVAEAGGETVGAVPMLVRTAGPFAMVNHWLPFPYLGPLLDPGIGMEAVLAAVRRSLLPRVLLHFGVQSTTPFAVPSRRGWQRDEFYSAIVPVAGKDEDALLALMSSHQRANVRRSLRRGLVAGPATRQEVADHLTPWANETLARNGQQPWWPPGAHARFFDALEPSGRLIATAVRRDGELLAVSTDLIFGNRLVAWEMGIGEAGRSAGASGVLHLTVAGIARDRGAAELDLLGTPTPGIANYKHSLGAEVQPRPVAHWVAPWLPPRRYLQAASARLRRQRSTTADGARPQGAGLQGKAGAAAS